MENREKFNSRYTLGVFGEKYAQRQLISFGLNAEIEFLNGHDILAYNPYADVVRPIKIEVKTAKKGKDGKYRATIRKNGKYGHADVSHSEYVIMLCLTDTGSDYRVDTFIIPVSVLGNKRQICITSDPLKYNGIYSRFYQNWQALLNDVST